MTLTGAASEEQSSPDARGVSESVGESQPSPVETVEASLTGVPLPPMVPGLPVLGHALELAGDSRPFLIGLYRKFGPIFRLRVPNQTLTVLAGPEANQFFSQAGGEHFRSRELWQAFATELGSDHLMNAIDGPEHAWQRKVMKPGFARQTMLDRLPEVIRVVDQACAKLAIGREIAVLPFMQGVVTEQLGVVLTGRSPGEYMPDIRKMVRLALNTLVVRKWPRAVLWSPGYRRAKARVRELANGLIADHRALAPPARKADMIDDLMAAHQQRPDVYTENDLRVGVVGPYIAGLDTVANTCAFMLRALLSEPEVLRSVTEEVDTAMNAGPLTAEVLKQMHALHGAAMETLRLYPVAALSQRT
ncbi:MAG TPA: cytochrome P450, partial [Polyangiaceae bacterium]|nr:cytochrome P450 [Polyangiaceae bacterium]